MTDIKTITYHSTNAPEGEAWLAYALLPSGQPWQVRFHGATESEAIAKAVALMTKERERNLKVESTPKADKPAPEAVEAATGGAEKVKGVYFHKKMAKWVVFIGKKYVGAYATQLEANTRALAG